LKEGLDYNFSKLIYTILEIIENPLKQKKPDVKDALAKINRIREICNIIVNETGPSVSIKENNFRPVIHHTYTCLYQCGFKTASIREIDSHMTNVHCHPDPQRDYSHPIYNET